VIAAKTQLGFLAAVLKSESNRSRLGQCAISSATITSAIWPKEVATSDEMIRSSLLVRRLRTRFCCTSRASFSQGTSPVIVAMQSRRIRAWSASPAAAMPVSRKPANVAHVTRIARSLVFEWPRGLSSHIRIRGSPV